MRWYHLTVEEFEAMDSPGNCELVVGVGRLVYAQIFRQLLLRQIAVLAQVAQPRFNNITSVILWSKAISLIEF